MPQEIVSPVSQERNNKRREDEQGTGVRQHLHSLLHRSKGACMDMAICGRPFLLKALLPYMLVKGSAI